jgi:hypothetical protein
MVMLGVEFLSEGDWRRGLMPDSTLGKRNRVGVDVFCIFTLNAPSPQYQLLGITLLMMM